MLCHWCASRAKSGRSVSVLNDLAYLDRAVNWPHAVVSCRVLSASLAGLARLAVACLGRGAGGKVYVQKPSSSRAAVALRFHGFYGTGGCTDTEKEEAWPVAKKHPPPPGFTTDTVAPAFAVPSRRHSGSKRGTPQYPFG